MGGGSAVVKESGKDASRLKFVGSNPLLLSTLEEGVGSVQTCNAESESVCDIAQWDLLMSSSYQSLTVKEELLLLHMNLLRQNSADLISRDLGL